VSKKKSIENDIFRDPKRRTAVINEESEPNLI